MYEEEFMCVFYAFKTLREEDLGKTVRRVLCNIADNATLELFSRTDKNTEKTPLPLHVFNLVKSVVTDLHPNTTQSTFEESVSNALRSRTSC